MEQLPPKIYLKQPSQFLYNRWFVELPDGVVFDDLLNPMFWSAHVRRLNRNDVIRVVAADRSFDCEVTVTGLMAAGAVVELLKPYHVADLERAVALQAYVEELRPAAVVEA